MRCELCYGYFPPFDKVDQMIYQRYLDERDAAEDALRDQWKAAQ